MAIKPDTQADRSYEVDIREVINSILGAWYWLVGALALCVTLAIMYLWLVTPMYETRFRAMPAPSSNFSNFNHFNDFNITPEDAYRTFGNRLTSYQNFEAFVARHREELSISTEADLVELFQERFSFDGLTGNLTNSSMLTVRYQYPEGESGDKLLNQYISDTSSKAWAILLARYDTYNKEKLAFLNVNLELERAALLSQREEEIFDIEKSITIARDLNIEKPILPYDLNSEENSEQIIYNNGQTFPKYYMGYQTLESERDELKLSLNEGLSNEKIREITQRIDERKLIVESIYENEVASNEEYDVLTEKLVDVIEYAFPKAHKLSPNIILVLTLSIVIGLFSGLVLVLINVLLKGKDKI